MKGMMLPFWDHGSYTDQEFEKAYESRLFPDYDNVVEEFIRMVHQTLGIRDEKKKKGSDGRRRQNQKNKHAANRATN